MMKILKKIGLLFFISIIMPTVWNQSGEAVENVIKSSSNHLLSQPKYAGLKLDEIKSASIMQLTVAGATEKEINNKVEIFNLYSYVNSIKLGKETEMRCTDNTTFYTFYLKDGTKLSVEKECDWIILGEKAYMIEK